VGLSTSSKLEQDGPIGLHGEEEEGGDLQDGGDGGHFGI